MNEKTFRNCNKVFVKVQIGCWKYEILVWRKRCIVACNSLQSLDGDFKGTTSQLVELKAALSNLVATASRNRKEKRSRVAVISSSFWRKKKNWLKSPVSRWNLLKFRILVHRTWPPRGLSSDPLSPLPPSAFSHTLLRILFSLHCVVPWPRGRSLC